VDHARVAHLEGVEADAGVLEIEEAMDLTVTKLIGPRDEAGRRERGARDDVVAP
jgi:hypothetical protein